MGNKHPKLKGKVHTRDASCFLCERLGYGSTCLKLSTQCVELPFLPRYVPFPARTILPSNFILPSPSNYIYSHSSCNSQAIPNAAHSNTSLSNSTVSSANSVESSTISTETSINCTKSKLIPIENGSYSTSKNLTHSQYAALYPALCKPFNSSQSTKPSGDEPSSELSSVDYSSLIPEPNSEFDAVIPSDLVDPSTLVPSPPTAYLNALNLNRVGAHQNTTPSFVSPNYDIIANQPCISLQRCDHLLSPFWRNSTCAISERIVFEGFASDSGKNNCQKYSIFSTTHGKIKSIDPRRKYLFSESENVSVSKPKKLKSGSINCELCSMYIPNYLVLKQHMEKHEQGKILFCRVCGQSFGEKSKLTRHQKSHFPPEEITETNKTKSFTERRKVSQCKTAPKPNRLNCQICRKIFRNINDLRKHRLTHSFYKPYSCDTCHKSFTKQTSVNRHKKFLCINDIDFRGNWDSPNTKINRKTENVNSRVLEVKVELDKLDKNKAPINNQLFNGKNASPAMKKVHPKTKEIPIVTATVEPKDKLVCEKCFRVFAKRISLQAHVCSRITEQNKNTPVEKKQEKITPIENELNKITSVENNLDEITSVKEKQDKVNPVENNLYKITSSEKKQEKITSVKKKQDKITSVENNLDKIVSEEEKQDKITSADNNLDKIAPVQKKLNKNTSVERKLDKFNSVEKKLDKIFSEEKKVDKTPSLEKKVNKIPPLSSVEKKLDQIPPVVKNLDKTPPVKKKPDKITPMEKKRLQNNIQNARKISKPMLKVKLNPKFKSLASPRKCAVCSKTFVRKSSFKTKGYKCKACTKNSTHYLGDGANSKDEENAVCKCETCGAVFATLSACKNHIKLLHSSERDLDCKYCDKSFKDSSLYVTHLKTHIKDYHECPVCNRKYYQKMNMKKHVQAQHKSYPAEKL